MLSSDRSVLYACTTENNYAVTKYAINRENKKWDLVEELLRSETDETEVVLQLKLNQDENVLFG